MNSWSASSWFQGYRSTGICRLRKMLFYFYKTYIHSVINSEPSLHKSCQIDYNQLVGLLYCLENGDKEKTLSVHVQYRYNFCLNAFELQFTESVNEDSRQRGQTSNCRNCNYASNS